MAEASRQYYCHWGSEQTCDENFQLDGYGSHPQEVRF